MACCWIEWGSQLRMAGWMRIAECILHEDPLDEFAMRLKCRILYAKGHIGLSRDIYDKWRVAYSHSIGTQPQLSFDDAIK